MVKFLAFSEAAMFHKSANLYLRRLNKATVPFFHPLLTEIQKSVGLFEDSQAISQFILLIRVILRWRRV